MWMQRLFPQLKGFRRPEARWPWISFFKDNLLSAWGPHWWWSTALRATPFFSILGKLANVAEVKPGEGWRRRRPGLGRYERSSRKSPPLHKRAGTGWLQPAEVCGWPTQCKHWIWMSTDGSGSLHSISLSHCSLLIAIWEKLEDSDCDRVVFGERTATQINGTEESPEIDLLLSGQLISDRDAKSTPWWKDGLFKKWS